MLYQPTGDNVITFTSTATLTGGDGGDGTARAGDGASGLVLRDGTGNNTLNLDNTITGGSSAVFWAPPVVGSGGHGIAVINMVGNTALNITGYVKGGTGGNGTGAGERHHGWRPCRHTDRRAQVIGGTNGFGGQAAAIAFTGGTNALTLDATSGGAPVISGGITHAGGRSSP
ncbi:MAG: hypothetical protein HZT43_00120 [Exiguobacterium profundum]|nr:MAG: hypothetical protein HZT43_00120 [Exiguobacterium profundum]